jgi:aminoglycoside phosphotransferase (APT) family kinase protein
MTAGPDVVATSADAAAAAREPLVVLETLRRFLDAHELGAGDLHAHPIGDGHSNVTYAVVRGDERYVLRRPPRGPLSPSTHDVLREARVMHALNSSGARVPEVLAVCQDATLIGAPFYVMSYVDGHVLSASLPAALNGDGSGELVANELVDALAEIHAVDCRAAGLAGLGRTTGYVERQVRRFAALWDQHTTRPLPDLDRVTAWLQASMPASQALTIVHGDFRLGNVMFAPDRPPRVVAVLDWEMAALGDPLADLGYLVATYARPGDGDNPMLRLSHVTRGDGFPERDVLRARYEDATGRRTAGLEFYEVLALWKSAIFLEGNWRRFLAQSTDDDWLASLEEGVPALARQAWERVQVIDGTRRDGNGGG